MRAAIDVGSNTVRMLIGECRDNIVYPAKYYRKISRLAGCFSPQNELAIESMQRTLAALNCFSNILSLTKASQVKVVGTAALRRAVNRRVFIDQVQAVTGLDIEIIEGAEEARLMSKGVLSVVHPMPKAALIVDIGGGSTEFVCVLDGVIQFQQSYSLGVVQLCEEFSTSGQRQEYVTKVISRLVDSLSSKNLLTQSYQLIGTAGTMTTLAAVHLQLTDYDAALVNNYLLTKCWLSDLYLKLEALTVLERERLIGMEKGRGDLILPGLDIVLQLLNQLDQKQIKVADSGLLEGVLLELCSSD